MRCTVCGYLTARKWNMDRHKKTHSLDKNGIWKVLKDHGWLYILGRGYVCQETNKAFR